MYAFKGENPTRLYYDALQKLLKEGDECAPRGKLIKELRPASVEFDNPYNRVTFLGSRRVNPFFQLAESLWIMSGRADVEWLKKFNENMGQFSDDGVWFNAPYGERIRTWNKNAAHNVILNPIDQLVDAYTKLLADKDTRQAVVVISNPMFDNSKYTIGEHGKDIACNLIFTLKVRHNKLNMTVFNRSNDAHWGLWGANLCQFTTIQEVMLNWLKNSGNPEFKDLEIGTYCQLTDSLHIYMDDYGAKCTTDVQQYYGEDVRKVREVDLDLSCENEPRMSLNSQQFDHFLEIYWGTIDGYLMDDDYIQKTGDRMMLLELLYDMKGTGITDEYWDFAIHGMLAYRLVKLGDILGALDVMKSMVSCQWKISMLYFLKSFIRKQKSQKNYQAILEKYGELREDVLEHLYTQDDITKDFVTAYLTI